jgi:hypothetical protein
MKSGAQGVREHGEWALRELENMESGAQGVREHGKWHPGSQSNGEWR